MTGSSIAAPGAVVWVTDFLNAAYNARRPSERDVDDLRLAFSVLTTYWHRMERRIGARDLTAFHAAFGASRRRRARRFGLPTLDRPDLLAGAAHLLDMDFAAGYADPRRTGWGIVFATVADRAAYQPERRLRRAALGPLSPPRLPLASEKWHTYPSVELPSAEAALHLLADPSRWPEFGSTLGRFTPLRSGGLDGQTFEIEVVAAPTAVTPFFTRGYVTATRLLRREDHAAELDAYVRALDGAMTTPTEGRDARALPDEATPVAVLELTTHRGHFIGAAVSRLVIFEHQGRPYICDVGSWDPMPLHLALPYRLAGHAAQVSFWGGGRPDESMLHQLALRAC